MDLEDTLTAALASAPPSVGPFWGVTSGAGSLLVQVSTPLASAEAYGDCLGDPRGHDEVWTQWQRLGPGGLKKRGLPAAIAWSEYDEHPRGRVVYDRGRDVFLIYADRKLHGDEFIARIMAGFGLNGCAARVLLDAHYRTP